MIDTGIPSALRYPGVYINIDGSQAGLGGDIPAVLLVGQKLSTGTAASGEIVQITGTEHAKTLAGAGSMLARMAKSYRAKDRSLDLYMLPYSDLAAGVQATGTITVTSIATANGTLALYIAQQLVIVGIATTQQAVANVATAIAVAITANPDLPVTAAATGAVVTLTARHKGTCGNGYDIRLNLFGETTPAGLGLSIAAMSGGTGDPAAGNLPAILGGNWYRYVALGMNDAATMSAWHTESRRRYLPPVQAGQRIFAAVRGDYAGAVAFGDAKNYEHICTLGVELNPMPTDEAAALVCAAAAPRLFDSPATSLEGIELTGMVGKTYFDANGDITNTNSLLYKGISVMQIGRDGTCTIKRLITMYRWRPDGSVDDAFLDINTPEVMERIRYEQRIGAIKRFTGTAAAKTNEGYRPGLRITTEDDVKAFLLSLYQNTLMREFGWVQAYDYYKKELIVEQDPTNPSRFNFKDDPVLLSPYYILAGRSQFRKAAPIPL